MSVAATDVSSAQSVELRQDKCESPGKVLEKVNYLPLINDLMIHNNKYVK